MNFQPKFEQADLKVTVEGDGAEVDLDLDRFKQIVANLLSNSIRYTEAGGQVHIHTEQNEKEWTLYVDDSPFGLTDEQLARIGERFYRVDKGRSRQMGGTGLGLAIVKNAILLHGGQISAKKADGGGLQFDFTLRKQYVCPTCQ